MAVPLLARRSPTALSEPFDGELLVLEPDQSRYMRLNGTGALVWEALESPARSDDIAEQLAGRWGINTAQAHADVLAFLEHLSASGLVELTPL